MPPGVTRCNTIQDKEVQTSSTQSFSCKAHPLVLLHLKAAPAVLVNIPQIVISTVSLLVFIINLHNYTFKLAAF